MFVDDGFLALAILAIVALTACAASLVGWSPQAHGATIGPRLSKRRILRSRHLAALDLAWQESCEQR